MNSKRMKQFKHAVVLFYNRRHHPLIIQWLKRVYNCRVTSAVVQLGDVREEENIRRESLEAGVDYHLYIDAREEFAENFLLPAVKAHAVYEDKYFLSAALARPMLAQKLVEIAAQQNADLIVHGFRGNDQVRLDMAVSALSNLSCLGVLREWDVTGAQIEAYAEKNNIPPQPGTNNPYSTSENIWGKSTECGPLEDTSSPPPREIFTWVIPPEEAPDQPESVTIEFEKGRPIAIDGAQLPLKDILLALNEKAAHHGVGITDMVEDGMVGLKSRAIYEHPGALCLIQSHQELERFICNRHENLFKKYVELKWAEMVYAGLWYDPLMQHLNRFIDSMNERVSGAVTLKLYKGTLGIEARNSSYSIYDTQKAIYNFGDYFGQEDAGGFGRVYNLHTLASFKKIKNKE